MQSPSLGDLIEILEFIILHYHHRVYIILNGVDEAGLTTQEKLLSSFAKLSTSCNTFLRFYFSTREITVISDHFPSCLSFDISEIASLKILSTTSKHLFDRGSTLSRSCSITLI